MSSQLCGSLGIKSFLTFQANFRYADYYVAKFI